MTTTAQLISTYASGTSALAFPGIGGTRASFADSLRRRVQDPSLINQNTASLCGPAAFMFCVASKHPEVYARYALELAEKGKSKIGKLDVEPSSDCKKVRLTAGSIDPVDWVTLASLRDSRNLLWDYEEPEDQAAGVTMPATLAGWFRASELFKDVINYTNLVFDKNLSDLLQADTRRSAGYYVCLFIGAEVLSSTDGGRSFPNHWVVLNNQVRIDGGTTTSLASLGRKVDDDEKQNGRALTLEVYTWGSGHYRLVGGKKVTVEDFLDYFYGYVCAK